MSRLPTKPREELSVDEQAVHDNFAKLSHASFGPNGEKFVWKDDKDALVGPFPFFISQPQVGQALDPVLRAFAKMPVPADVRETTICTYNEYDNNQIAFKLTFNPLSDCRRTLPSRL